MEDNTWLREKWNTALAEKDLFESEYDKVVHDVNEVYRMRAPCDVTMRRVKRQLKPWI